MYEQLIVFIVIIFTLTFFINGKLRYDFVSLLAILSLALLGIISFDQAFVGFSHPAVSY